MLTINPNKIIFLIYFLLISCSAYNTIESEDNNPNNNSIITTTMEEFENKLDSSFQLIDSVLVSNNNKDIELIESIIFLNEQIDILRNEISNIDSMYKKSLINLRLLEDNIQTLSKSFNEVAQIKIKKKIEEIPPISDAEFKEKYIASLGAYQNGELDKSLNGFIYLTKIESNYDLLDNCQYWIGEIYFKMKKYHQSIIEFNKVFKYLDSNKRDDSLYKLAKCFMNLGNDVEASAQLNKLINNYPNSEYVRKAKLILNK